jgi:hypothetical protein
MNLKYKYGDCVIVDLSHSKHFWVKYLVIDYVFEGNYYGREYEVRGITETITTHEWGPPNFLFHEDSQNCKTSRLASETEKKEIELNLVLLGWGNPTVGPEDFHISPERRLRDVR